MLLFTYNDYLDYNSNYKIQKFVKLQNKKVNSQINIKKPPDDFTGTLDVILNKYIDIDIEKLLKEEQEISYVINDYFKVQICEVTLNNLEKVKSYLNFKSQIFKVKGKDIYFLIKLEKNPNYNMPYIVFDECMEFIKKCRNFDIKKMPIIVPIIIYIGNKKWNVKNYNCIKYTSFGENNVQLGYNIIDFNLYKTNELVNKKSKISKCIIIKKEIDMYLTRMQYNL